MKIRWYQQRVQGIKPRASEKYKDPNVATNDTTAMKIKPFSCRLSIQPLLRNRIHY